MLRTFLLFLSQSKRLPPLIMRFVFTRRTARRFIAGETLEDAVAALRELNQNGRVGTLTHLGEDVATVEQANADALLYLPILDRLHGEGLRGDISIKLTQIGQYFDQELAFVNLARIVENAAQRDNFVWLDMMQSTYTSSTLEIYERCHHERRNVGVAIQANLRRSAEDIQGLLKQGASIRLCKGSFAEPTSISYARKSEVDANYKALLTTLLGENALSQGVFPAIATHDPKMIAAATALIQGRRIPQDKFEFQMLHGIRTDLQERLVKDGYQVRIYVPYGKRWYQYFVRRLAERPANLVFFIENLFRLS